MLVKGDNSFLIEIVNYGEMAIFIIMGLASVIAFAVFVERYIIFSIVMRKEKFILNNFSKILENGNYEKPLRELSKKFPKSIYSRLITILLNNYKKGRKSLVDLVEGNILVERINLEKRLVVLNTLGNNAPFIGLLGTVFGIIKAFDDLGSLGSQAAEMVMKSISTALFATAFGLAIAIPIVMVNNYFTRKIKVIISKMEAISKEFLAELDRNKKEV